MSSSVGYGTLFVIGSIANFIVLIALIKLFKKTKTRVNLLLIHLTIADLLVTIFLMPLEIGWASTGYSLSDQHIL
jgi:gonadotropin-releasing hormone receptor